MNLMLRIRSMLKRKAGFELLNKYFFHKPWLAFVFLAIVILGCATIFGLLRPLDGLKSFVWFILLGTFFIFVDDKTSKKYHHYLCWTVFLIVFIVDLASQGVVRQFFGATPQPNVIAEALANTNPSEAKNFIIEQRYTIIRSVVFASLSFFILTIFNKKYLNVFRVEIRKINRMAFILFSLLIIALHFNPTMLRQQPFLRWFVIFARHAEAQEEMRHIKDIRSAIKLNQSQWNLTSQNNEKTVVLVIGESANRNNWGQYGYSRPTTLPLENTLKKLPGKTVWFAQAKSSEAFTLSSLQQALTSATKANPDAWKSSPDIIMLAKAAGYHITWLSNQPSSEGWISSLGKSADVYKFINHGNWRDSSATDMDLLPELKKQLLATPPNKELIILHLLGQHFHYALRCPEGIAPYKNIDDDSVMLEMQATGKLPWVRQARNDYDNATYCGAVFLSDVLTQIHEQRKQRETTLIYFSDHGQEVGHTQNFSGHSNASEQGYTIPLFIWNNKNAKSSAQSFYNTPFSLEHLDHLLQDTLGINSIWYDKNLDPLQSPAYPKNGERSS